MPTDPPDMTPAQFITKWKDNPLSERAGSQAFFLDLCSVLGVEPPNAPDTYCFERGATRTGAGHGWADVWKRGHFGWENKGPGGDLSGALRQLMTYALALDNPPLLVVSNREITQIHTHFTGTPSETYTIRLEDIGTPENLQRLRWLFTDPEKFRPGRTVLDITADAAGRFADVAKSMTERGHDPAKVAHFLIQCLFCMFAEDIGLLPKKLFERVIAKRQGDPVKLAASMAEMFEAMRKGGDFLLEDIAYFNGGLFEHVKVLELAPEEIGALLAASRMDWSAIEPSILGTLFERGLDPKVRAPLGANYTDPTTIMKLVKPVIVEPLEREWEAAKARIAPLVEKYHAGGKGSQKAEQEAQALFLGYLERLKNFRVLDPACGSGNFLYLALRALKDLEHRANLDAEALGLHRQLTIETSPDNVRGIEINAYAAELARVTVWIGEIQWMLKHGYDCRRNPILARLDHIENRDALLNADGSEAEWPEVDAIVGNPPFLGGSRKSGELGVEYFDALNAVFADDVPGGADLVCYWFHKSEKQIESGRAKAAGLVSTNSIRGGANRAVLDSITATARIFEAWSDEPWVNDGAAVRVSLIAFGAMSDGAREPRLNGQIVPKIHADLTAGEGLDLSRAQVLPENSFAWAYGSQEKGKFDISEEEALALLKQPNPHACPNSDVIRRSVNARQIARRRESTWVIDFGVDRTLDQACLYEGPFAIVTEQVAPARLAGRDKGQAKRWWLHARPSPKYRTALASLPRVIVTPCVSKHRLFAFLSPAELADHQLAVVLRSDDTTFGVLQSRFHELWSLRLCTWLGVGNDPRYTPSTTFETFPFPAGMTPADTAAGAPTGPQADAIAAAARRLNELRENWLNPAEWVDRIPEVVPGYPDRVIPKPGHEAELKKRTLTNLYNQRPAWLDGAHKTLDAAVAAAYGWTDYTTEMPDDEILRRLLALNLERAGS
jgi:hypothetical protein